MPSGSRKPKLKVPIAIDTVAPLPLADEKKDYDRVQELARTWQRRKQLDEDFENLYWMRRQESAPKEDEAGEEIISPKCMDAINLGVDLLTTRSPNFTVVPLDDDRAAKQEAEQAALWLKSFFYALQRQQRRPFFSALVHHALLLGRCVCRAVLIEDAPKGKLPVRLSVRDPKFFFPSFDEDGVLYDAAELMQVTAGEVRRKLPEVVLRRDKLGRSMDTRVRDQETVEWAEYWTADRYVYFVNGQRVGGASNPYGFVPYIYAYGRYTPSSRPEEEPVSLLHGARTLAPERDVMLSAKATAVVQYVNGVLMVTTEDAEAMNISLKPGKINYKKPNEEVEWLTRQGEMPDLDDLTKVLSDELDDTTFKSLKGDPQGFSGYAFQQARRGEQHKINPVKENLEWALGDLCKMVLALIGQSERSIALIPPRFGSKSGRMQLMGKVVMEPALARKYADTDIFVEIPPDYLEDPQLQMSLAVQSTSGQSPILDKTTARTNYLHIEDPTEIEERIAMEQLTAQTFPAFVQYVLARKGFLPPAQGPGGAGGSLPPGGAPPGSPQQPFAAAGGIPPNGGAPQTNPQAQGIPPTAMPAAAAGIPPGGGPGGQGADAINAMLGQGVPNMQAMQLLGNRGTPQATGRGR